MTRQSDIIQEILKDGNYRLDSFIYRVKPRRHAYRAFRESA